MKKALAILTTTALLLALPAGAQPHNTPTPAPQKSARMPDPAGIAGGTMVSLNVSASRAVTQDRVRSQLSGQAKSMNPTQAQDDLNKQIQTALEAAKKYTDIQVATGSYSSYHENNEVWVSRQDITLDSANKESLVELTALLQKQGMAANGLSYYLSAEKQESLTNDLIGQALKNADARAGVIAQALGRKNRKVVAVRHNTSGPIAMPMMMKGMAMRDMAAAESFTPPSVEPDQQTVTVSIDVDYLLGD